MAKNIVSYQVVSEPAAVGRGHHGAGGNGDRRQPPQSVEDDDVGNLSEGWRPRRASSHRFASNATGLTNTGRHHQPGAE